MKTTDLLTFFQTGSSDGTTWTFTLRGEADLVVAQLWVFSRGGEDLSQFASAEASTQEQSRTLFLELFHIVEPRGGMVFCARELNGGAIRLELQLAAAREYDPPRHLLRLSSVGNPGFLDITDRIDLEVGDHLVVPVSVGAESRLRAFYQNVQNLPPDLQSSVLNVIRRPSLEWRVERIERAFRLMPATRFDQKPGLARQRTFLAKLSSLFMRPFPIGPVLALALVLTAGTMFAYDKFFREPTTTEVGSAEVDAKRKAENAVKSAESATTPESSITASKSDTKSPETAFDTLFDTLEISRDPNIKRLFGTHFEKHRKNRFKSSDISWGITKLQGLQLNLLDMSSPVLNSLDAKSMTEEVYRDKGSLNQPISRLKGNAPALALLAYTWCQHDSRTPGLPKIGIYHEPLLLTDNCSKVVNDDVVLGLEALTDWVKQQDVNTGKS